MPQVVLMLKMPCDSTSWTGTQVANHSWLLALAKSWTGSRRFNALMSRVLGASPLRQWANEQSNILTDTGKTENQQDQPPDRDPSTTPRRGPYFPCLYSDDSCGFQWRDVDAVTPEFPLVLENTSPEYFRHPAGVLCKQLLFLVFKKIRTTKFTFEL